MDRSARDHQTYEGSPFCWHQIRTRHRSTWIDGAADDATERIPREFIEPVEKIVEAILGHVSGRSIVEPWIEFVNDGLEADDGEETRDEARDACAAEHNESDERCDTGRGEDRRSLGYGLIGRRVSLQVCFAGGRGRRTHIVLNERFVRGDPRGHLEVNDRVIHRRLQEEEEDKCSLQHSIGRTREPMRCVGYGCRSFECERLLSSRSKQNELRMVHFIRVC